MRMRAAEEDLPVVVTHHVRLDALPVDGLRVRFGGQSGGVRVDAVPRVGGGWGECGLGCLCVARRWGAELDAQGERGRRGHRDVDFGDAGTIEGLCVLGFRIPDGQRRQGARTGAPGPLYARESRGRRSRRGWRHGVVEV